MLYPYVYRLNLGNAIALFHPLNMSVIYYANNISDTELYSYIDKSPCRDEWIVPEDFDYDNYVNRLIKENDSQIIDVRTLKMFTTTNCNLNCAYCLIEKNLEQRKAFHHNLSLDDGLDVLKKFSDMAMSQKPSKKTIMLYGGEPLLNKDNLFEFIRFIRSNEKKGLFNGEVEIVLESNGTIVTDEIAEFLKENNIFIIVSLDGIPSVHNAYRKTQNGNDSYTEVKRGFDILNRHGCLAVISSVFTDEYAENIDACLANMTENVKPKSIGLNLFHVLEDQEIKNDKTDQYYDKYIHAFEVARKEGLYIEHIMRRIRPLVTQKVRIKDCGACGNRIVSDVDGNIGICEGLVGNPFYFKKRANYNEVKEDPTFLAWSKRTPLTMKMCKSCPAIGICGAGCVNNALLQNGDIYSPDNYICGSSKAFIDWALKTWFTDNNILDLLNNESGIHVLSITERSSLRGSLGTHFEIPLQTMSKQYETEGAL